MTKTWWLALLLFVGCGPSAYYESHLPETYANDYSCESDKIEVTPLGTERYRVTGCDHSATYTCGNGTCAPDIAPSLDMSSSAASAAKTAANAPPDNFGPAHLEKNKNTASVVALDLRLDAQTLLKLRATPDGQKPIDFTIVRLSDDSPKADCVLAAMVDGQRVSLPKAELSKQAANDPDNRELVTLRTELSPLRMSDLAVVRQFAMRDCDLHWTLAEPALKELRHFAEIYQEERAWQGPALEGGTGGLMAPAGGWPAWSAAGSAPQGPANAPVLDAPALFKVLSPSVFRVLAVAVDSKSQGSAVAVSPTELLTNCHVVQGAQKITLQQGKLERKAELARANPAADRCVLRVSEATLTPIRGVRAYADLQIGEPLYTLGSPNGLELSLASGILSGKRDEGGRTYVQTTAPISPGSSGGGLFDARGNLVGITSMVLADHDRLNQALNFAIPADSFWLP